MQATVVTEQRVVDNILVLQSTRVLQLRGVKLRAADAVT